MSSEWEDGQDVYRHMWDNYDNHEWHFGNGEPWAAWHDPVEDSVLDPPSSSTFDDSQNSPPRPGLHRTSFDNHLPSHDQLHPEIPRPMGNTSSSANTANTRTQQAPQARPQIHTTTSDHRTAPTADYSEDWLDSEAANRNSPYGYIPEEFFQSLDEDSSEESFLDGIDIDEILSEDSVGPAAAAMPPRRNANHNSYVDLTNDASPPGQSSRSPRQPISLKRSAEGSSQGRSKKRTKRTAEDKANIEELDLTNEAPSAEEELLQNQQKEAIKAQQASDDNDPSGPLKIGKRQCIICMENFTNATITSCGHIYCHECLTQALIAGEKNSDRGVGNCPVCRKPVQRKKDKQVIPIAFMKKSAFKGKARRDMSVLG